MNIPRIENMTSHNGNEVPNQFRIFTDDGVYFQSYKTIIAFRNFHGNITLDPQWDYSMTTGKYRNIFLRESRKETERKIKSGEYKIVNLN